jgi:hypothetical protein
MNEQEAIRKILENIIGQIVVIETVRDMVNKVVLLNE